MRQRELRRLGARVFVVKKGDRFPVKKTPVVGFIWSTSGRAWVRSIQYASKFSRTLARLAPSPTRRDSRRALARPQAGSWLATGGAPPIESIASRARGGY